MSTKKNKFSQEQKEALFWKRFSLSEIPKYISHVNFRESSVTDEEIGYLVSRIKKIDMLDLHDTSITNEGIKHLTKLESLKELRLKENTGIDNGCMQYVNQLKDLEFLHLRYTKVNVHGLKDILDLQKLKTVLISSDESQEEIDHIMKDVTAALPNCEFWVNNTSYFPKQPWELL